MLQDEKPTENGGTSGLKALLEERGVEYVTFEDWKKIEQSEEVAAKGLAPRRKFAHIEEMLNVAK